MRWSLVAYIRSRDERALIDERALLARVAPTQSLIYGLMPSCARAPREFLLEVGVEPGFSAFDLVRQAVRGIEGHSGIRPGLYGGHLR